MTGIAADAATAFDIAMSAIRASGGEIRSELAPQSARFSVCERSLVTTAGLRVWFNGDLAITAKGPRYSTVRVSVNARWSSLAVQFVAAFIAACVLGATLGQLGALIAVAVGAWQSYNLGARMPRDLASTISSVIQRQALTRPSTRPSSESEVSWPIPSTREPTFATPPASNPAERLKQLVELRASGVLSPEEFDARKADLLRRL